MIAVTRLDKHLMYLNPDHIISIEETPDTVITLFNGNRYIVVDPSHAIINRIVAFRAKISRRASARSAKKYLGRIRTNQFNWTKNKPDDKSLTSQGILGTIPFHSRDY